MRTTVWWTYFICTELFCVTSQACMWTLIHPTHIDPQDGGSLYLRNAGSIIHIIRWGPESSVCTYICAAPEPKCSRRASLRHPASPTCRPDLYKTKMLRLSSGARGRRTESWSARFLPTPYVCHADRGLWPGPDPERTSDSLRHNVLHALAISFWFKCQRV
jgi:hypothetical protein